MDGSDTDAELSAEVRAEMNQFLSRYPVSDSERLAISWLMQAAADATPFVPMDFIDAFIVVRSVTSGELEPIH